MYFMTKKEYKKLRAELLMMDVTFSQIAKKFYTSRQMVQHALKGDRDSDLAKNIRSYVTGLLGSKEEHI